MEIGLLLNFGKKSVVRQQRERRRKRDHLERKCNLKMKQIIDK